MKGKNSKMKSVVQRVANRARERRLTRNDALVAYTMDRLLYRLGRSAQAREFFLKGGVLVANLVAAPHRFTRDIDLLRSHGPPDPNEMRRRFREIAAIKAEDGLLFDAEDVRATVATREQDGYEGVRVALRARMGETEVEVHVDIGFGDALVPPAERSALVTFLDGDPAAEVYAYDIRPVLAEEIETLIARFPVIEHRLKDLLDVAVLARETSFDGEELMASLRATFERRQTPPAIDVLDEMATELCGRRWATAWGAMRREKAVSVAADLVDAVQAFDTFVRPLLLALAGGPRPGRWQAPGPWSGA